MLNTIRLNCLLLKTRLIKTEADLGSCPLCHLFKISLQFSLLFFINFQLSQQFFCKSN